MAKTELLYGLHSVAAVLKSRPEDVLELLVQMGRDDSRIGEILQLAVHAGLPVQRVKTKKLEQLLENVDHQRIANHQGILARCRIQSIGADNELDAYLSSLAHPPLLLFLDSVSDPQNLGACLRVANGAGVDAVVTTKDKAAGLTPVVRRVASGAVETTPFFQITNLARTIRRLQNNGIFFLGTALEDNAITFFEADMTGSLAIVMGAEGKGLRRLVKETVDQLVYLPMKGSVQSLNVATASGICLYEALRQRQ